MITLATLENATAQEVFDQVVNHLRKQGKRSLNSEGDCAYRGKDGLMCAAGCLIGDDEYKPEWDESGGLSWSTMVNNEDFTDEHDELIDKLQFVHDSFFDEMENELPRVAKEHDLIYTAPQSN